MLYSLPNLASLVIVAIGLGAKASAGPLITPAPTGASAALGTRCTPAPCPSGSTLVILPHATSICDVINPCPGVFTCVASGISIPITRTSVSCTPRAASTTPPTAAAVEAPHFELQCGGMGWAGPTACAQGTCVKVNEWFSFCQL
ncbi:hypothetical protein BKA70DRAFT_1291189 [Coprinopsis sp. MPI-PUGE-AT-0042]|nr:hypothetical protein BKA70DRAFT_1291189 [Coprinopsis sp. MPI-PUGE-AT-0042]